MNPIIMRIPFVPVIVLLACFSVSCNRTPRPADLPDLYDTKITITQDGKPLEGATVSLLREDLNTKWATGGKTNASGVCTIRTQGSYPGAPEGKYKVAVYKKLTQESPTRQTPMPSDPKEADEYYRKISEEEKTFDLVDLKYKSGGSSGLTLEVSKGAKNEFTFDVGPEVKTEFIPFGK